MGYFLQEDRLIDEIDIFLDSGRIDVSVETEERKLITIWEGFAEWVGRCVCDYSQAARRAGVGFKAAKSFRTGPVGDIGTLGSPAVFGCGDDGWDPVLDAACAQRS